MTTGGIERGDFVARLNPRTGTGLVRQNANPLFARFRAAHCAQPHSCRTRRISSALRQRNLRWQRLSVFRRVGRGKTTMTRLAPPDVTLLSTRFPTFARAASNPHVREEMTPPTRPSALLSPENWQKLAKTTKANIGALFFLEQGPVNRIDELSSAEAIRRLMRNILFFAEDPSAGREASGHRVRFRGPCSRSPPDVLSRFDDVWEAAIPKSARGFEGAPAHV